MTTTPTGRPAAPIRIHRMGLSGHCHRVELFCSLLGLPFERVEVNLAAGEQKAADFLAKNPFGQVPVIEDGDVTLADSNAILVYLEARYAPGRFLPRDPVRAAEVQRWLTVAAGPLAFGAAAARVIELFRRPDDPALPTARANALLKVMDAELARHPFLVGDEPTLADIANYSYTAHAPEGNVSLEPYPNVQAWLRRVEALPGFIPMTKSSVGLWA